MNDAGQATQLALPAPVRGERDEHGSRGGHLLGGARRSYRGVRCSPSKSWELVGTTLDVAAVDSGPEIGVDGGRSVPDAVRIKVLEACRRLDLPQ